MMIAKGPPVAARRANFDFHCPFRFWSSEAQIRNDGWPGFSVRLVGFAEAESIGFAAICSNVVPDAGLRLRRISMMLRAG